MSFSNILTSNLNEPPKATSKAMPAAKQFQRKSHTPNGEVGSALALKKTSGKKATSPNENVGCSRKAGKPKTHSPAPPKITTNNNKIGLTVMTDKDNERVKKEMEKIDAMELTDAESPAWEAEREAYIAISLKRQVDLDAEEERKRKVRQYSPSSTRVSSLIVHCSAAGPPR